MAKVLVIDDDLEIQELLKTVLILKGFEVIVAASGKKALELCKNLRPDIVLLDLTLPDMDGIDVCRALKTAPESSQIPVLMLTARSNVIDRVRGLEIGANDYLIKPFDNLELLARINVQLRSKVSGDNSQREVLQQGAFLIDPNRYHVTLDGKAIKTLTPREFDILYILAKNCPQAVPREEIFNRVWGPNSNEQSRVIDIHVAKIRKKIGSQYIKTIPRKGYLFSV